MSGDRFSRVNDIMLRQTAFSVEQMAPGGIERPDGGIVRSTDIDYALGRLDKALGRSPETDPAKRRALQILQDRTLKLRATLDTEGTEGIVYVAEKEFRLPQRLRSAAIEIDFCFGDKDGVVSLSDLRDARRRYGLVRGPVGWNRLLVTDEIERHLYPERTLKSTDGLRLLPQDWLDDGPDPLGRLRNAVAHLDDSAIARTYADIAARLATVATHSPTSDLREIFESALLLLGAEIKERNGVRPTITDIARIGCEDPEVKAHLKTPIEMSRKLQLSLIERFLPN